MHCGFFFVFLHRILLDPLNFFFIILGSINVAVHSGIYIEVVERIAVNHRLSLDRHKIQAVQQACMGFSVRYPALAKCPANILGRDVSHSFLDETYNQMDCLDCH